ncbi:hypothetical protein J4Q44_G00056900 [Coregonus suidteri]|uniref:Ig-like domain-containing protein n=1 Tax=Coregonus suidteri TaxID=861788 RepID=A0AAN8MCN6_9TELE
MSDSGDYRCLGLHIEHKKYSEWSDAVRLTVTALPTASVKIVTTQEPLYSGDTVKLQCDISDYTDWTYHWLVSPSVRGQGQERRPQKSYLSSSLHISVTALPETTLTVNPNPAYTGETVTLTCSVGSDSDWSYTWYKDNTNKVVPQSEGHTTTGATFTISRPAVSDQGLYWCQGEIQSRSISSIISDPVTITVKVLPTASVKASPQGPVYSGETVTLQCDISDYRDWTYRWHRDNQLLPSPPSETITFSLSDQAGQYQCEGTRTRRPQKTYLSPSVTIIVAADPKENPVYSEVKTENATATGPVDVTYAEVDLKQQVKAKKKKETETPPEADSVYSQVKPVTAPVNCLLPVTVIDEDIQPEETVIQRLKEMSGGPFSCFSKQGILLLILSNLHYGLVWYTIYVGVSVGGAVVLILTVAVAVFYCRGRRNTGMYCLGP